MPTNRTDYQSRAEDIMRRLYERALDAQGNAWPGEGCEWADPEADRLMRRRDRVAKVAHPSDAHRHGWDDFYEYCVQLAHDNYVDLLIDLEQERRADVDDYAADMAAERAHAPNDGYGW